MQITTIRLDAKTKAKITKLKPKVQKAYPDRGKVSDSEVTRMAIIRGLEVLEKEVKK